MIDPAPKDLRRIEELCGQPATDLPPVQGGYTPAERWLARLADGTSVFVKIGTTDLTATDLTATDLRSEHRVYSAVDGPFMPRCRGWDDDESRPILLLEDLSQACWPPPWSTERIDAVLECLEAMHDTTPPLLPYAQVHARRLASWQIVAEDPRPFLGLEIASSEWLAHALPTLLEQEARVDPTGADNICLRDRRALLVDWNCACLGNPEADVGFWLPSLEDEGGPPPEEILPDCGHIAAAVSGFFAARAGMPVIHDAPRVRIVQSSQLARVLPWAVRSLQLPPLA